MARAVGSILYIITGYVKNLQYKYREIDCVAATESSRKYMCVGSERRRNPKLAYLRTILLTQVSIPCFTQDDRGGCKGNLIGVSA